MGPGNCLKLEKLFCLSTKINHECFLRSSAQQQCVTQPRLNLTDVKQAEDLRGSLLMGCFFILSLVCSCNE